MRIVTDVHLETSEKLLEALRRSMTRLYADSLSASDIKQFSEQMIDDCFETISEISIDINANVRSNKDV
tara:strand:+ start:291 stop:497 length:207 start_codon:yes stop_codon:yes gene_type:complete